MEVITTIDVDAPTDRVWAVLDEEFGAIDGWASRMLESGSDETLGPLGGRRVTTVEYGPATETLYRLDPEAMSLGYWVSGPSLPPPIGDVQTEWRVTPQGDGATVSLRFLAHMRQPEAQPMLEERLAAGTAPLLEELKHYAETGTPHANKLAAAS